MGNKKKNASQKPASTEPKKERKKRDKMRGYKDNAAGHFADRLAANVKQRADIFAGIKDFPGINPTVDSVETLRDKLNALATQDPPFAPAPKKSGRQAVVFVAGQRVKLAPEAIAMLKSQFTAQDFEALDIVFAVSDSHVATDKDKQVPIRFGGSSLDVDETGRPIHPFLGFLSKKWVSAAA